MTAFWIRSWDALAAALFPTPCVCCGGLVVAYDPPLCRACWTSLPAIDGPLCACGTPLPGSPGEACGRCRRGLAVLSMGASLGAYEGPLRDCVLALKYSGRHRTASRLAVRLLEKDPCLEVLRGADLITGVPLHRDRLRLRGFNQAELLAAALARGLRTPLWQGLVRTRNTRSQTDLSARDRRKNVLNAFTVHASPALRDACIVLVDDVTTTGATLRECASTLLAHGAREVRSITVARAE